MKKVRFLLLFVTFLLLGIFTIESHNLQLTDKLLYENIEQINMEFNANTNIANFIGEVSNNYSKTIVSQMNFDDKGKLQIYTNNLNHFQKISEINPNVKVNYFDKIKNVGLGNSFFIGGQTTDFIKKFSKYGKITVIPLNKGTSSMGQGDIISLIVPFTIISLVLILISALKKRKILVLKKKLGYSTFEIIKDDILEEKDSIFGIGIGLLGSLVYEWVINTSYPFKKIVLVLLFFIALIILIIIVKSIFLLILLKSKENMRFEFLFVFLAFTFTICFSFIYANQLKNDWQKMERHFSDEKVWDATKKIYKTNVSNQLDRSNNQIELSFDRKSREFYRKLKLREKTFIIDANNFTRIESNRKSAFLGQLNSKNNLEYLTQPYGNSIVVDENYLIMHNINNIPKNMNSKYVYLLVPRKYKKFESKIKQNYSNERNNLIFRKRPQIKIIFIENNQEYFTYSDMLGDEKKHVVIDPIVTIFNDNFMSWEFYGNLLVSNGYLFYKSGAKDSFKEIEPIIKESGLTNTINFSVSLFKQYGQKLSQLRKQIMIRIMNITLLIISTSICLKSLLEYLFTMNKKKIFIKELYGDSFFERLIDLAFAPFVVIIVAGIVFSGVYKDNTLQVMSIIYIVIGIISYINITKNKLLEHRNKWL